jgi:hypothetical protein
MKVCFKCGINKSIGSFYIHKQMADGHLNKCIDCTKSDVKKRTAVLINDSDWVESEKKRHREKYYRLNYKEKHKPSYENKKKAMTKYYLKFPEKKKCRNIKSSLKPKVKGNNLHHWSYNIEHAKDVIELNVSNHNKAHRFLKYDKSTFMYKDLNGNLLNTKQLHLDYINKVIENF